jgi:ubiquinone/menaquinone biosynthesis C-methylase UbiE
MEDWIIYVTEPDDYHKQSFIAWDEEELTSLTDYTGKTVVDIGSGTGKQAFAVAPYAKTVYCVEPVWNLRRYLKKRAEKENISNIFVVDGIIQSIPFAENFADITISGHVVGEDIICETNEMERITKQSGMIILCPGNIDADNGIHQQLMEIGYNWSVFLEPGEDVGSGYKRKYWKIKV